MKTKTILVEWRSMCYLRRNGRCLHPDTIYRRCPPGWKPPQWCGLCQCPVTFVAMYPESQIESSDDTE